MNKKLSELTGDELVKALAEYMRVMGLRRKWVQKTKDSYISTVAGYVAFLDGRPSNQENLNGYVDQIVEAGRSFESVCALKKAMIRAHAFYGEVVTIKNPLRKPGYKTNVFTDSEYETMRDQIDPMWRNPVIVGYNTGLRLSDVKDLKWESINLNDLTIRLIPRKTKFYNKKATIPIVQGGELHQALMRMRANSNGELVFPQLQSLVGLNLSQSFMDAARAVGVKKKGFHVFRRTFITRVLGAGMSPLLVKEIAAIDIKTLQHYAVPLESSIRAEFEKACGVLDRKTISIKSP